MGYPEVMDLYARVNILGGRAVRLPRGNVREAISLDADPVARAVGWVAKGADRLHIVDLDAAAYGDYRNRPLINDIIEAVDVPVMVAGGIRSRPEVESLLDDAGAWRIVIGTAAIEDQVLVWDLCRDYPAKIAVSIDVHPDEELAIRGWTIDSGVYMEDFLIELSSAGAAAFMVSEVDRDALSEPANLTILRTALTTVDEPVISGGGARDPADLRALVELTADGKRLDGLIVGREITEGRMTLEEVRKVLDAP